MCENYTYIYIYTRVYVYVDGSLMIECTKVRKGDQENISYIHTYIDTYIFKYVHTYLAPSAACAFVSDEVKSALTYATIDVHLRIYSSYYYFFCIMLSTTKCMNHGIR